MLVLGGKTPLAEPGPNIKILIARLHKAVGHGEVKVPKTVTDIQKYLGESPLIFLRSSRERPMTTPTASA